MNVIEVKNLSKKFKYGVLRTSVIRNLFRERTDNSFYALNGLNFTVNAGEMLGVIGTNGSGKTTLLKILAGIIAPTGGEAVINGNINFFLRLGIGFQIDLTARENIYLYGALLGLSRRQVNSHFNEIIRFAELEGFVDTRLKYYSSGMQNRLAFSTAMHAGSDILLLDEVFAVGDLAFQAKCLDVLRKLKKEGKTIILVSHTMEALEEFCDKALYLNKGVQVGWGGTEEVIASYKKDLKI